MVNWGKLIFGGVDSSDYGIYITGEAVYNAPERDVEFIAIPGRNGSLAMDKGRYNNITVTYPAGAFGKTQEEFRKALSDFRNAILSQTGYQRLEDTYHPEEFRMAVYASGLEVSPVNRGRAGEFDLSFTCKPQRWLSVGALPMPVDSGDVIQNPTLFESSPLLEVEGYGTVSFNGFDIELDNSLLGNVTLINRHMAGKSLPAYSYSSFMSQTYKFDRSLLNTGDIISVGGVSYEYDLHYAPNDNGYSSVTYTVNQASTITPTVRAVADGTSMIDLQMWSPVVTFSALSPTDSEVEKMGAIILYATKSAGGTDTIYVSFKIKCGYDYITYEMATSTTTTVQTEIREVRYTTTAVSGNSTIQILGNPTYIDCENGEAYRIENDEYKSSNARVSIGAELPTLTPGANRVTFDNTVTDLKIAPRWWKI